MDPRLAVIALILFVNNLGAGLILPLLPFYAIDTGASPLVIGMLIATLPFFATLSGPPLGALSDHYGRRPILAVSVAGTVLGLPVLGAAQTLPLVFLARIVDGVSAGNTSTARAAIADIASPTTRPAGLGVTFAMESLGIGGDQHGVRSGSDHCRRHLQHLDAWKLSGRQRSRGRCCDAVHRTHQELSLAGHRPSS